MGHLLEFGDAVREIDRELLPEEDHGDRVLLVGELNPYGGRPEYQLVDYPDGCAGERLRRRVLGLTSEQYLACWRVNLCRRVWGMKAARAMADLLLTRNGPWTTIVMLGRKVATAFSYDGDFFTSQKRDDKYLVSIPHPSGLCRIWNEPGSTTKARALLRWHVPEILWGGVVPREESHGSQRATL